MQVTAPPPRVSRTSAVSQVAWMERRGLAQDWAWAAGTRARRPARVTREASRVARRRGRRGTTGGPSDGRGSRLWPERKHAVAGESAWAVARAQRARASAERSDARARKGAGPPVRR